MDVTAALSTQVSRVSSVTILSGRSFQSFMAAGKENDCLCIVRHRILASCPHWCPLLRLGATGISLPLSVTTWSCKTSLYFHKKTSHRRTSFLSFLRSRFTETSFVTITQRHLFLNIFWIRTPDLNMAPPEDPDFVVSSPFLAITPPVSTRGARMRFDFWEDEGELTWFRSILHFWVQVGCQFYIGCVVGWLVVCLDVWTK